MELGAGRAVEVPIQPGMVHENLQAAADEENQEKKLTQCMTRSQPGKP